MIVFSSLFSTTSLRVHPLTMKLVYDEVVTIRELILNKTNCSVGAGVQPVTRSFLENAKSNGGDAIDLDPEEGGFCSESIHLELKQSEIFYCI